MKRMMMGFVGLAAAAAFTAGAASSVQAAAPDVTAICSAVAD